MEAGGRYLTLTEEDLRTGAGGPKAAIFAPLSAFNAARDAPKDGGKACIVIIKHLQWGLRI
jgi:hypothetical protein